MEMHISMLVRISFQSIHSYNEGCVLLVPLIKISDKTMHVANYKLLSEVFIQRDEENE